MGYVQKESLRFETPDHFSIAADFSFDSRAKYSQQPCVILVHRFLQSREQWGAFPETLVEAGYKTFAYDIRGHGSSDKVKDLTSLLSDPQQAPFDFDGVMDLLTNRKDVDAQRLAVVGMSIGGYIACAATAFYPRSVRTAVAISISKKGVLDFLRHRPGKNKMRSVLYIAAEKDRNHARDAKQLAEEYTDLPTKVEIYEDSAEPGADLINGKPEIKRIIMEWLRENLK